MSFTHRRLAARFAFGLAASLAFSTAEAAHRCESSDSIWNDTQINEERETALRTEFSACLDGSSESVGTRPECQDFVAKALDTGWGASDFNVEGTYLGQRAIAKWFDETDHGGWDELGTGTSQDVLNEAASRAAKGDAVIAIYNGGAEQHVAIILPGGTAASSSWNMMKVPRAINLPLESTANAFFGCRLSWGYSGERGANLTFYAKASGTPAATTAAAPATRATTEPAKPAPATPAEPAAPAEPAPAAEPVTPAAPATPTTPEAPVTPDEPDEDINEEI